MGLILENQTLEFDNVLCFKGIISPAQMNMIINQMRIIVEKNGAEKVAAIMTTTHSTKIIDGQQFMNVDIIVPVNKKLEVPTGFKFKEKFKLTNAVKTSHEGNPGLMQNSLNELMKYVAEHNMVPITSAYNVTVREPKTPNDTDDLIIDIYVGVVVNPNIL